MKSETKSNLNYALKFLIPIMIVVGLFLGGVSAGIITFENPNKKLITGEATATIEIDFRDGTTYSKAMTLDNSTVFDFLLELEKAGDISIETTYWESFGGYSVDSITYQGNKYEGDANHYWAFYVNGVSAMEGADKIYVNNNDVIKWEFVQF
jgi:hypothetical protein